MLSISLQQNTAESDIISFVEEKTSSIGFNTIETQFLWMTVVVWLPYIKLVDTGILAILEKAAA